MRIMYLLQYGFLKCEMQLEMAAVVVVEVANQKDKNLQSKTPDNQRRQIVYYVSAKMVQNDPPNLIGGTNHNR